MSGFVIEDVSEVLSWSLPTINMQPCSDSMDYHHNRNIIIHVSRTRLFLNTFHPPKAVWSKMVGQASSIHCPLLCIYRGLFSGADLWTLSICSSGEMCPWVFFQAPSFQCNEGMAWPISVFSLESEACSSEEWQISDLFVHRRWFLDGTRHFCCLSPWK